MSDDLRSRVLRSIAAHPAPTRSDQRWRTFAVAAVFVASIGMFAMIGHRGGRSTTYLAVALAAHALAIGVSSWWLVTPGRALGRARPVVRASAAVALGILIVGALVAASTTPEISPAAAALSHLPCSVMDLGLGALFFAVAAVGMRPFDPVAPRATAGALGVLGLSWASLAMALRCTRGDAVHVLTTHVGPGLVLVLVGAWFGARWFGVRSAR